ncbi:iron ABC transporter permease [Prauserella sp. PE36]|uniref:Iron ABC transporter permease n=1 Tax=Prauserella endophytica TaxID=1592324 RepID=A0ABY2S6Q5_9PSEU|nr:MULTISPECIES: iron chelate uptake ABC transporter family permease subunit [Prauserella]RBM16241.1 iron ABC transporter permease [Prauserella sp. PE36]TKG70785.1 iron ABC transporter permease [Prauserella endophytica]
MTERTRVPTGQRRRAPASYRLAAGLAGLAVLVLLVSVLGVVVGARPIELSVALDALRAYDAGIAEHQVIADRAVRTLAGLLVGAALGLAGVLMQGITRNPLADPGLLGINAGAAFAVVCAIGLFGVTTALGYVWFAFAGALFVAVVVYVVGSLGRGGATPVKVALAGAAVSAALVALTTAVLLTDSVTFDQHRFWTVGSLAGRDWDLVAPLTPFVVAGVVAALFLGRALNALSLGDDVASGLGQRVGLARGATAVVTVVLCGAATAIAGPIWFVGLFVAHLARLVTGPDYRWILPYSLLLGPVLVLAADVLGRVVAQPGELQVGIVLSLVGSPFLIMLVRYRKLSEL